MPATFTARKLRRLKLLLLLRTICETPVPPHVVNGRHAPCASWNSHVLLHRRNDTQGDQRARLLARQTGGEGSRADRGSIHERIVKRSSSDHKPRPSCASRRTLYNERLADVAWLVSAWVPAWVSRTTRISESGLWATLAPEAIQSSSVGPSIHETVATVQPHHTSQWIVSPPLENRAFLTSRCRDLHALTCRVRELPISSK
mmetsp:Transcript_2763/g.6584  ORF Transcript_2763/g.6584 Transcript_2763/m.6584 type:complete len:202 (-) Transcript_2763:514-1119(-)